MVVPGDSGLQVAPRVVSACIKSYHDIPEELFNSLQESSVDPPPALPPRQSHSTPPRHRKHATSSSLLQAPRSDWKTMRDGRRALLTGDEASDTEGSEPDLGGGPASTSDYHTSDGRGSSLSGASDDHHHNHHPDHYHHHRHDDQHSANYHQRIIYNAPGVDAMDGSRTATTSVLQHKFRGFCSTMLDTTSPSAHPRPPSPLRPPSHSPPSPPPATTPRGGSPGCESSRLEEELRAAGVYFRRPGTSAPRVGSGHSLGGEAEAVAAALGVLDASLAGLGGSSGESSPERSHSSSVAQCGSPDHPAHTLALHHSQPNHHHHHHQESEGVGMRPPGTTVVVVGGAGGPDPTHPVESNNLIEEVYVDTRTAHPASTVSMRAYYPGVTHTPTPSPTHTPAHTPRSSLKPPLPGRHSSLGGSGRRDPPPPPPGDSDSGHESGATSPCGTLTGDDTVSPPPSPPHAHTRTHAHTNAHPRVPQTNNTSHSRTSSLASWRGAGVIEGEVGVAVVGETPSVGVESIALDTRTPTHFVVVAIDFGTTFSGYAFSFTRDPDSVHMMKKWEGGDPGVQNQKTPTIVLLTPDRRFHSLGFTARDTYHDLDPKDAQRWLYFDRFKMALHADQSLSRDTVLEAANGVRVPALDIFCHALAYFRRHALTELSDMAGVGVLDEDVRWVITVPAIWSHPAKQFMRTAAYQAGLGSVARPDQLLIALEPEAAAIYCRRLRPHQLLPDRPPELRASRHSRDSTTSMASTSFSSTASTSFMSSHESSGLPELDREEMVTLAYQCSETVADWLRADTVYCVVDCGGGTVDITVHQMTDRHTGHLKELHKASGGPYGSTGVDGEFQRLLETIFGTEFIAAFKRQRPAAFVDLMIAFESRKRNASPFRENPLNIALPFSFIDLYKKFRGKDVEWAIKKHHHLGVRWSTQGMLRVEQETMRQLFLPTLANITQAIQAVVSAPEVGPLQYMFLVGGFAESELLQKHIRDVFGHRVNVIIPQGMSLAILRGAVQFGLDPGVVTVRRSRLTYGVGVLNRYQRGVHPSDKRVVAAGSEWCADVLDRFVGVDESVAVGDVVVRSYTPATPNQSTVILHLYATERHDAKFVSEAGVERVGTLHLDLTSSPPSEDTEEPPTNAPAPRREITVHMRFGDTEVKASAVDHVTGQCVKANIDFLAL